MLRSRAHKYASLSSACRLNGLIGRRRFPTCCREALVPRRPLQTKSEAHVTQQNGSTSTLQN